MISFNPSLFLINSTNEIKNPPSQPIKTQSTLTIVSSLPSPPFPTDLAWDGEYLWVAENDLDKIYQINSSTGVVIHSFNAPGSEPSGLTWDGLYLWCADWNNNIIYQINSSTGAVVYSFNSPGPRPTGLAWDGQYLWNADNALGTIYKINASIGAVVASFDSPSIYPKGLAWDGQFLWVSIIPEAKIYAIDPSNGVVVDSLPDPGGYTAGLAWDGHFLWESDHLAHNVNKLTVEDTTNPVIIASPNNFTVEYGYTGQNISWTATDLNPYNYTIELIGTGIVVTSTSWANNTPVVYNIPDGFSPGVYTYSITFTDGSGNSISNTVTVTINSIGDAIPFGNFFLIFIGFSVICLIFIKKRHIVLESR